MARLVDEARANWRTEIAARPLDADAPIRRAVEITAAVALAAVFFDVVVTWAVLHRSIAWEQNPVATSMMREIGVAPTLALGGLLRGVIVAGLTFLALRATRGFVRGTAAVVLGAVALWWAAVVFANAVFLGRLG